MAIHTDRPGGGDDKVAIHRATSADEARRARAALEEAGVACDLPDQAIDAIFSVDPKAELPVKVALKDASKAIKAISAALPRKEEPTPIADAADPRAAASETLAPVDPPSEGSWGDLMPATAVARQARKALLISMMSVLLPPAGFVGAIMGFLALREIRDRPKEEIPGAGRAKVAIALGLLVGIMGSAGFFVFVGRLGKTWS
ncbi:DUF4190 domain-containing protein [bacterium]|nr:DUF4190 domain-containing protein [bacterium]